MGKFLLVLTIIVLLARVPYWLLCWYEKRQKNTWRLVVEGAYDHVEVRGSVIAARRLAKMGLMVITTIFFQDGKTWPIRGVIFNPPAPGTEVQIYKNGFGESRIETDQAA